MTNKTKIYLIIFIIIFLTIIGVVVYLNRKKPAETAIILPAPSIPARYQGTVNFTMSIKEKDFKKPDNLPLFEISSTPFSNDYINNIAKKLGFAGDSYKIEDVFSGTTYYWKGDKATLFAYPKTRTLHYSVSNFIPGINIQLSDESIVSLAKQFFVDNGFISNGDDLTKSYIRYLKKSVNNEGFDDTTKESASLFRVGFSLKTIGYETVNSQYNDTNITIEIQNNGEIYSVQFIDLGSVKEGLTTYPLKGWEEINNSLSKAVLISLEGQQLALADLQKNSVRNVEIQNIKVAYLYEGKKATTMQPIYVLTGPAEVIGFSGKLTASFYLPAILGN